ncbi:MAG: hypothetical protein GY793_09755 [Proteobacteria bacterium]|nr:hypothetical protein [Pseudomonadota bacterium]
MHSDDSNGHVQTENLRFIQSSTQKEFKLTGGSVHTGRNGASDKIVRFKDDEFLKMNRFFALNPNEKFTLKGTYRPVIRAQRNSHSEVQLSVKKRYSINFYAPKVVQNDKFFDVNSLIKLPYQETVVIHKRDTKTSETLKFDRFTGFYQPLDITNIGSIDVTYKKITGQDYHDTAFDNVATKGEKVTYNFYRGVTNATFTPTIKNPTTTTSKDGQVTFDVANYDPLKMKIKLAPGSKGTLKMVGSKAVVSGLATGESAQIKAELVTTPYDNRLDT